MILVLRRLRLAYFHKRPGYANRTTLLQPRLRQGRRWQESFWAEIARLRVVCRIGSTLCSTRSYRRLEHEPLVRGRYPETASKIARVFSTFLEMSKSAARSVLVALA